MSLRSFSEEGKGIFAFLYDLCYKYFENISLTHKSYKMNKILKSPSGILRFFEKQQKIKNLNDEIKSIHESMILFEFPCNSINVSCLDHKDKMIEYNLNKIQILFKTTRENNYLYVIIIEVHFLFDNDQKRHFNIESLNFKDVEIIKHSPPFKDYSIYFKSNQDLLEIEDFIKEVKKELNL